MANPLKSSVHNYTLLPLFRINSEVKTGRALAFKSLPTRFMFSVWA